MAAPLNARRLADRIRQKIEDRDRLVFADDTEVLEAADEALESIHTEIRLAGREHNQDFLDVPVSSLVAIEENVFGYTLPAYMADTRLIELKPANGEVPVQIQRADLGLKDVGRGPYGTGYPVWHFSKRSGPGQIELRGRMAEFTTMRIYFTRRWGSLFYATVGNASQTVLNAWTEINGRLLRQADLYREMQVEVFEDSTNPQNVDHVSYVSAYDPATQQITLETALPATSTAGDTKLALVVPMEPEHSDYVSSVAAYMLLGRLGSYQTMQAMAPLLAEQKNAFLRGLNQRDTSTQRSWFNSN